MPDLVVVAAVIFNDRKQILMAQRAPRGACAGHWEIPGGKVESGETGEQAVAREIKEELDLIVDVQDTIAEVTMKPFRRAYTFRVYACSIRDGVPKALAGQTALEWIEPLRAINDYVCTLSTYAVYKEVAAYMTACGHCGAYTEGWHDDGYALCGHCVAMVEQRDAF